MKVQMVVGVAARMVSPNLGRVAVGEPFGGGFISVVVVSGVGLSVRGGGAGNRGSAIMSGGEGACAGSGGLVKGLLQVHWSYLRALEDP